MVLLYNISHTIGSTELHIHSFDDRAVAAKNNIFMGKIHAGGSLNAFDERVFQAIKGAEL